MSINNITRTNTVDEWRIQTNLAATEINKLETGDYTKTAGTLEFTGASNVIIDSTGTSLQVTNTALFSTNVTVGKYINLGAQETATGNLGVGGVVSIYGPNTALYVANNIISNGSMVLKNSIIAANTTINSNAVVVGTTNTGYLGVANTGVFGKSVSVGTTLAVTGNAAVGNLTTANMVYAGTLRTEGRMDVGTTFSTYGAATFNDDVSVSGDLSVDGNFTLTGDIVYDTDSFILSTNTPVTAGYAYIGVFRGNTTSQLGTANANAYIRWSAVDKNWQIRDVDNNNNSTAFSKVLTANLITTNFATTSNSTFPSTWSTKDYVDTSLITPFSRANSAFAAANAALNAFVGTDTYAISPSNGVISFSSGNGVTIKGSANTLTINTSQDLQSTASPTFASLSLTAPLAITQGGTGSQTAGGALTALLPSGTTAGYVLTTGGPGNFYWAAGGGGSGGSAIPGTAINTSKLTYTATSGQTTFNAPAYTVGAGQLKLFINGVRQHSDYTETTTTLSSVSCTGTAGQFSCSSASLTANQAIVVTGTLTGTATISQYYTGKTYYILTTNGSTTFTLSEAIGGSALTTTSGNTTGLSFTTNHRVVLDTGAASNDLVMVEVDGYYVRPYYANNIGFTPTGNIPASSNTIQLGMESIESRKANLSGAVFTGGIATIAPATTDSSTTVPTTGWVKGLLNTSAYTFTTNITGNAGTVTNGVYTSSSYSDPSWLTISKSKVGLGNVDNTADSAKSVNYATSAGSATTATSASSATSATSASYAGYLNNSYAFTNGSDGWFRSKGSAGWYNEDYAGGIYMTDTTWVRVYNGKAFYVGNQIAATGDITAYYSDERLKDRKGNITGALDSVLKLNGFRYTNNDLAKQKGYTDDKVQIGVSAQEVESVYPELVKLAPFDMKTLEDGTIVSESGENYKTVDYSKLVPVLIEAIKELKAEIDELKGQSK